MVRSPYPPLYRGCGAWACRSAVRNSGPAAPCQFWRQWLLGWWAGTHSAVLAACASRRGYRSGRREPVRVRLAAYARVDMLALAFATAGVLAASGLAAGVPCSCRRSPADWRCGPSKPPSPRRSRSRSHSRSGHRNAAQRSSRLWPCQAPSRWGCSMPAPRRVRHHVLEGNASNPLLPLRAMVYVGTFAALHLPALAAAAWWVRRAITPAPLPIAIYCW